MKLFKILNDNTESNYKYFLRGFRVGNIIRNLLIIILVLLFAAIELPYNTIGIVIFVVLYFSAFIFMLYDIFSRTTIVAMNKDKLAIGLFIFKKIKTLNEFYIDDIKYVSYEGLIFKKMKIEFIDNTGKLVCYSIWIPGLQVKTEGYFEILKKAKEMQKVFDRGDF